ncbi:MAG: indole-3-glycerol phosphate synthase TrpC [Coriobacteriaceae bacterium]|nr:indole-3-glycerol phosphate synthase TrpC [Coriobacteriaceae bacterium]
MDILQEIAESARERVAEACAVPGAEERMRTQALERAERELSEAGGTFAFPFEAALAKPGISFICECKKASPSRGVIAEDFPYLEIAKEYEAADADAISVLTEPKWFLGDADYLRQIAAAVSVPCLCKDFVVSEYQIFQAKTLGAAAVLLICALLDDETLASYLELTHELGMSALVEAHSPAEIARALDAGAKIVGVNNRDLTDFTVDVSQSRRLRELVPADRLFVAESGIKEPADMKPLEEADVDAVLIGEACMRADDKTAFLTSMREA